MSTPGPSSYLCPPSTFSNRTSLSAVSECSLSLPGTASVSYGLTEPSHPCGPGHFCLMGAQDIYPSDGVTGDYCSAGYVCLSGAFSPQPSDYITGYAAPPGTYAPTGSSVEIGCAPGSYNPTHGATSCLPCPAGAFCPGNSTTPGDCPEYYYCPEGTSKPILCPAGTYNYNVNLTDAAECNPCTKGNYCVDGRVSGECSAAYFCRSGMSTPTPNVNPTVIEMYDIDGYWMSLDGGQCPPGHYCGNGTFDPASCENMTIRAETHGVSADDCGGCPAGFICYPGNPVPIPCHEGYYCMAQVNAEVCPMGTHNPLLQQESKVRSGMERKTRAGREEQSV